MRIVFSRKGFDSSSGGAPSPIIDGRPVSLPIPASRNSLTSYGDLDLGDLVHRVTRGRIVAGDLCHADPWFAEGQCAFGQSGAALGHLANNGVCPGDVFLFFGLFTDEETGRRHHRIYGYMKVDVVMSVGARPDRRAAPSFAPDHPHFIGDRDRNNTVYVGPGRTATSASEALRLTKQNASASLWTLPTWVGRLGLTYHGNPERWLAPDTLQSVAKGQEFVCDIGEDAEAAAWLENILAEITGEVSSTDEVILTMLRRPRRSDPSEQRNDPFWEFGSFGLTGCHGRNLLHPRRAHEHEGRRLAFAQGGPDGFRLVHVTPPISVRHHGGVCELRWPAAMPLAYATAPIIIDNAGRTAFPALLEEIEGVRRSTPVSQFASKFRVRREPVTEMLAAQLVEGYAATLASGACRARRYTDALPFPPPRTDTDREATYRSFLAGALADAPDYARRRRC